MRIAGCRGFVRPWSFTPFDPRHPLKVRQGSQPVGRATFVAASDVKGRLSPGWAQPHSEWGFVDRGWSLYTTRMSFGPMTRLALGGPERASRSSSPPIGFMSCTPSAGRVTPRPYLQGDPAMAPGG